MALRLTVDRAAWESHVAATAASIDGLVPVVKGNGYGFGRQTLHAIAATLSDMVCVGTIYELDHVPDGVRPVVLTPTRRPPRDESMMLTVGSVDDVQALAGWRGGVFVKLQSTMRRFGATPTDVAAVVDAARECGLDVAGFSLHLPLAATSRDRTAETVAWLEHLAQLDPAPLWLSHLEAEAFHAVRHAHPERSMRLRVGTQLWHGDKSFIHLGADVLAVHQIGSGERAGYQQHVASQDGSIAVVGAGSAHGIAALPDGRSPFHFARTRLALFEPPHMHSSMAFVPAGQPCPSVGDMLDVQRPLITSVVDEIEWR